ncbi:E3 ubiquitin-protein ligase RFWD3 [Senna tora]|uniref:E3 ubiquitin-protein ligase RMA n=1 Tax=Senna tora TaxID=362788 RepID=A0A834SNQ6_9FABA|nr:E3 ubiquitin-protein ligase RFWD3 [Senna tora]
MGEEETSNVIMNLDLYLGPASQPQANSEDTDPVILVDNRTEQPLGRFRDVRQRARQALRWRQPHVHAPPEAAIVPMELDQFVPTPGIGTSQQAGQASVEAEPRTEEVPKACENNNGMADDEASEKNDDVENASGNDGTFFDCNICLDLSKDPVVTCCGHLFCWSCLYRWLHVHSEARECPVCKGEVTSNNVTPIYGRANNNVQDPEEDPTLQIPLRPHARRVENLRQTIERTPLRFTLEGVVISLTGRYDHISQYHDFDSVRQMAETTLSLLNELLISRAIRREHNHEAPPNGDTVEVTQNNMTSLDAGEGESRRPRTFSLQISQSPRDRAALSSLPSTADRVDETYLSSRAVSRSQEQNQPVDDRDSYSSVAAVINSESQVDAALEIDSMVSSSRRRNDASRVSDVNSGDSPAHRRRRRHGFGLLEASASVTTHLQCRLQLALVRDYANTIDRFVCRP